MFSQRLWDGDIHPADPSRLTRERKRVKRVREIVTHTHTHTHTHTKREGERERESGATT